ncbi:carbohydrate ABC transporter permease [Paenibacillus sp. GCM10027626]|uniref:carbohydrate ABC transporter permease n=1 Tax=Paenibacillus sp. GCM10027626 TaxID=3273411 RepID=UPI00362BAB95
MHKYSNRTFKVFNMMLMCFIALICIYPFLYILALSLSDSSEVLSGKVSIYPKGFNLTAYQMILQHPNFLSGYKNTVLYTVVGTAIGLFMTIICAYPLSKKHLKGKGIILGMILFSMLFSGGLIPSFLLVKGLGLYDSIWAIVIPGAISPFNMIIMRTFFQTIPDSLEESAAIDGLNPIQILIKIVLPLSKPIIATIGLFSAVYFWNDWFYSMIYLSDNSKYPVMMFLRNIVAGAELAAREGGMRDSSSLNVVSSTLRSATIMMVTLPILLSYPFVQKYFVKGMMIGSIKG